MTIWIETLPDEIYRKIYSHVFRECAESVAQQCNLDRKHRTLSYYHTDGAYEELFKSSRSNVAVVYAWLVGKRKRGHRMSTDGQKLRSYQMVIGDTR
jgi:hypothetical protein